MKFWLPFQARSDGADWLFSTSWETLSALSHHWPGTTSPSDWRLKPPAIITAPKPIIWQRQTLKWRWIFGIIGPHIWSPSQKLGQERSQRFPSYPAHNGDQEHTISLRLNLVRNQWHPRAVQNPWPRVQAEYQAMARVVDALSAIAFSWCGSLSP